MIVSTRPATRIDIKGSRHYEIEGYAEPFPSVTTVLGVISKPALIPWARRVALEAVRESLIGRSGNMECVTPEWVNKILLEARRKSDLERDRAKDQGSYAHDLIESTIRGDHPEIPDQFRDIMDGFEKWRASSGLNIELTEAVVYSDKYRFAGSMDAIATRGEQLVAIDWKTGNALYPEHALQIAAYSKALEELTGRQVKEAWLVRFSKSGSAFEARRVFDIDRAFIAFRAALHLWRSLQEKLI